MFLFGFVYTAKKASLGECQLSEFPAKLTSKRRRLSSLRGSDGNLPEELGLRILNTAAFPSTDGTCALETSATLSKVIHSLGIVK